MNLAFDVPSCFAISSSDKCAKLASFSGLPCPYPHSFTYSTATKSSNKSITLNDNTFCQNYPKVFRINYQAILFLLNHFKPIT